MKWSRSISLLSSLSFARAGMSIYTSNLLCCDHLVANILSRSLLLGSYSLAISVLGTVHMIVFDVAVSHLQRPRLCKSSEGSQLTFYTPSIILTTRPSSKINTISLFNGCAWSLMSCLCPIYSIINLIGGITFPKYDGYFRLRDARVSKA